MRLTISDFQNILALFKRVPLTGLDEAEALVLLKHRIIGEIEALQEPPVTLQQD